MKNEFIATQKYLIMSPRKLRLVVELIKKMKPVDAVEKMPFIQKRAGEPLSKVIKNAMASARALGVSDTDLVFKEIQIGEGPRLKRGRPASRGRWHPFKKRMSHVRVILVATKKVEKPKSGEAKEVKKDVDQKESKIEKKTSDVIKEK